MSVDFFGTDSEFLRSDRIPYFGYCADQNKVLYPQKKSWLMKAAYFQPNRHGLKDVIVVDVDSTLDTQRLKDADIPEPRYYAGQIYSTDHAVVRPHLVWFLSIPVKEDHKQQMQFFEAVRRGLIERLREICKNVDPKPPIVTKNPTSDAHETIGGLNREWTLRELAAALGMGKQKKTEGHLLKTAGNLSATDSARSNIQKTCFHKRHSQWGEHFDADHASQGRNCMLFESIRALAYAHKAKCASYSELHGYVLEQAIAFNYKNNFNNELNTSEVEGIARSISRFTWHRYVGRSRYDCNRGAYREAGLVDETMEIKERQCVAGRKTAQTKAERSLKSVKEAREALMKDGHRVTVKGLARYLQMSKTTVKKHLRKLEADSETSSSLDLKISKIAPRRTFPQGVISLSIRNTTVQRRGLEHRPEVPGACVLDRDREDSSPIGGHARSLGVFSTDPTFKETQIGKLSEAPVRDFDLCLAHENSFGYLQGVECTKETSATLPSPQLLWELRKLKSCGSDFSELATFAGVGIETISIWLGD